MDTSKHLFCSGTSLKFNEKTLCYEGGGDPPRIRIGADYQSNPERPWFGSLRILTSCLEVSNMESPESAISELESKLVAEMGWFHKLKAWVDLSEPRPLLNFEPRKTITVKFPSAKGFLNKDDFLYLILVSLREWRQEFEGGDKLMDAFKSMAKMATDIPAFKTIAAEILESFDPVFNTSPDVRTMLRNGVQLLVVFEDPASWFRFRISLEEARAMLSQTEEARIILSQGKELSIIRTLALHVHEQLAR